MRSDAEGPSLKRVHILLALLVATLTVGLLAAPASTILQIYLSRLMPAVPLPAHSQPGTPAEGRLQDVADLSLLPHYDRSFSPDARLAFARGVDALKGQAATLSDAAFEMAVSRLVALAGNAHTTVDKAQRVRAFGRVPLRFAWFAEGLYVVRARGEGEGLLGRRVIAIDGRPITQAVADLRPYLSGTAERAREDSLPLLECPALLQVVWPDTDGRTLGIVLDDGLAEQIAALPPAPDPLASRPIFEITQADIGEAWRTVLDSVPEIPLSLRAPARVAYSAPLDNDGLYVRINVNEDDINGPLSDQLAQIVSRKPPHGWRCVVLDLRFNDGGNERKTMALSGGLRDLLRPDGDLWILTGNATFSAAIITAARAKYFAGPRAHIIGEAVGDRNPFWTDGGAPFVLRNSGIVIGHAYLRQDWVNGCRTSDCNPLQFIYGVAAGDLTQEITVGWSFSDYAAGRDTVMERIRALMATR